VFEGFALQDVPVGETTLRTRHGGTGTPILLLHGHPRTHATWHKVGPLLASDHVVVCPDLRGYGESSKPATDSEHTPYSKRAMAADCVELMSALGHERFAVAGHDRGCYVAHRLTLDHPNRVTHLIVIDGIPIGEALARADARFAERWWHWFFYAQTDKAAERVINADPDEWYGGDRNRLGEEAYEDYRRAIHNPETVHAMLEDYRAGLGIDRAHDDDDKKNGRRISCPVLFLWASRDDMVELYGDPTAIWREWATDVSGKEIESGHHIAEEAPEILAAELRSFLASA
jgi:haloacetate dehalogenase